MKKQKLKLKKLKVQSFVTARDKSIKETIKGGIGTGPSGLLLSFEQIICDSSPERCQNPTDNRCGSVGCETFPTTCVPSGNQIVCDTSINCF